MPHILYSEEMQKMAGCGRSKVVVCSIHFIESGEGVWTVSCYRDTCLGQESFAILCQSVNPDMGCLLMTCRDGEVRVVEADGLGQYGARTSATAMLIQNGACDIISKAIVIECQVYPACLLQI